MNEKLQAALVDIIKSVVDAKDFLLEQAPSVVIQLLDWYFFVSIIYCSIGVFLVMLVALYWCLVRKFWGKIECEEAFYYGFGTVFSVICIFSAVAVISSNLDWLKILIAPKLYLIEYAAGLAK